MTPADRDIFSAIATDTRRGFGLLVATYSAPIYRHIRRMVVSHHDAEDATQETFVRAFRSIGSLRDSAGLRSWLFRIATNEALRTLDRLSRRPLSLDSAEAADLAGDSYVDYSDLEAVRLKNAILSLPPRQQAAFNLRYYDELSYDEIARALDSTPANVKANYHHAKERIINYMNSHS